MGTQSPMRPSLDHVFRFIVLLLPVALVVALAPRHAWALTWPDVEERVERDLAASHPVTRRAAAKELRAIGPARGGPLALASLDDPDDEVRLAAAEAAIRLRAAGATDAVLAWLNAQDARLRHKACEVARALPSPRAVAPLARSLGDPDPEVRAEAAEALGYQASPDAVPPLLGRLDDPTPSVRVRIVAALARLRDTRAVVPLVGKISDSSTEVRQAVAQALGDLGDRRASSALVLAVRDQASEVRRDAIASLGRMRASDAVDALAPFVTDRTASLRLAALAALGRIATPDAVRVLVGTLGSGDDASGSLEPTPGRHALVTAGAAALPSLHALLTRSPSPQAATSAAWVLGALHARAEASLLVDAMRRGALPTAAALHALAGAGSEAEVPVVLEFVTDSSALVRDQAARTALALLDPDRPDGRAVEPLAAALRDTRLSTPERARIAALLGRTGAPRAATLLVDLVRTRDLPLRLAAIDALGTLGRADTSSSSSPAGDPRARSDDALIDALGSAEAATRLHAAVALSEVGAGRARDALLAKLDAGDEVDRAALLTALGGVLSRIANDASVAKLADALRLAAGAERDAVIEALGRAPLASAMRELGVIARSPEPADRRAAVVVCGAHAGDARAIAIARALLADSDAETRAQAAWALGAIGDPSDVARLEPVARGDDPDAAANAVASVGRIAARAHSPEAASRFLCQFETDVRPYVRANALAGLGLSGARCGDGSTRRTLLAEDPSEDVRAAAASAIARAGAIDDKVALDRCANSDPSGMVATRCNAPALGPSRTHASLVYVVPEGAAAPRPNAPYAVLFANGLLRAGLTDRRGAVFDPVAAEGDITLRKPSALSR
jgi:HEAT repeat protein